MQQIAVYPLEGSGNLFRSDYQKMTLSSLCDPETKKTNYHQVCKSRLVFIFNLRLRNKVKLQRGVQVFAGTDQGTDQIKFKRHAQTGRRDVITD